MTNDAAELAAFLAELPDYPDWCDRPLHLAAVQGRISIMEALVRHGADPTIKNDDGFTPLELFELMYGDKGAAK